MSPQSCQLRKNKKKNRIWAMSSCQKWRKFSRKKSSASSRMKETNLSSITRDAYTRQRCLRTTEIMFKQTLRVKKYWWNNFKRVWLSRLAKRWKKALQWKVRCLKLHLYSWQNWKLLSLKTNLKVSLWPKARAQLQKAFFNPKRLSHLALQCHLQN